MTAQTILLVGGPDSGKTNYLARAWESLRSRKGALKAPNAPDNIKYVEDALAHLLQGKFAPRTDKSFEEIGHSFSIGVESLNESGTTMSSLVVPDVSGELWTTAVETSELPNEWMTKLRESNGAILFLRVGSDQNVEPLDWVTAGALMGLSKPADDSIPSSARTPTQVIICELLRHLEYGLAPRSPGYVPRVALVITAWDRLDSERAAAGPWAFLEADYPLLAGKISSTRNLEIRVFGVSVVGGDFTDPTFTEAFFETDLYKSGYVIDDTSAPGERLQDLTLPIAWVIERPDW